MARTIQDKIHLALLKRGEQELKHLTGCIVMTRSAGGCYYLGKAGSLRFGATRSGSIPVSNSLKKTLISEGE